MDREVVILTKRCYYCYANLFINIDVPSKVRSKVLNLCANVLLHDSDQRDLELFQLRLQRGQLRGLLQKKVKLNHQEKKNTLSYYSYF